MFLDQVSTSEDNEEYQALDIVCSMDSHTAHESPSFFDGTSHTSRDNLTGSEEDLPEALITQDFSVRSFRQMMAMLFAAALPFCASRLAISVQGMGYAYLMGQFGPLAISAGPLISGLQNAVVTPLRSGLGAINVLVPSMQQPHEIGRLVQQTYASTLILTLPTLAILLNAGALLRAMGTDSQVAAVVQDYMRGYAWGILPIYTLVIDQQLSLAIGKRGVATLIGLCYASLVLVLGYVLTMQVPGAFYHNTYGLGLGFAISAWVMSLGLKVCFGLHPDYQPYQLFQFQGFLQRIKPNLKHIMTIAVPMWLQSLSESFNLMVISILMSRISNNALMAEQVSLQWMTAFSPVILAIANVTCSLASRLYGEWKRFVTHNHLQEGRQVIHQLSQLTCASLLLAASIGLIFASLFLSVPRALTHLLVPHSEDSTQDHTIEVLSTAMLRTNSVGIWTDSLRLTLTGYLLGIRDAKVPALLSFLLISGLGLLIGGVGTEVFGFNGDFLFMMRNLFIIVATLAITGRWFVCRNALRTQTQQAVFPLTPVTTDGFEEDAVSPSPSSSQLRQLTGYGSFFDSSVQATPVVAESQATSCFSCCIS